MLGVSDDGSKRVVLAVPLKNAFAGPQGDRYELRPEDLLRADREARTHGMDLVGIFHSHPDCDAYFSATDLKNSCPWYSFVVISIRQGEYDHSNSWLPQHGADRGNPGRNEGRSRMTKILIPTPLRQYVDKQDSVEVTGATVGEALGALTGRYQELRRHLYSDEGKLRSFVNVYLNDEDIRYLGKDSAPLSDGDTLTIVPSIAGGSRAR